MKYLLLSFTLFFCGLTNAQSLSDFSFESEHLNATRKIWLSIPSDSSRFEFPCIYLLGAQNNDFRIGILQDDFIIVGIESQDSKSDFLNDQGRENFFNFLREELIPYIDEQQASNASRFISGHSLAGGFAVDVLIKAPELFSFYMTSSPTLHVVNHKVIQHTNFTELKALYFNIGQGENYPQLEAANHAFHFTLDSLAKENFQWKFEVMKGETHETNEYTGFCRAYSFYKSLSSVPDSIIGYSIQEIVAYTDKMKADFGIEVKIDEKLMMSNILINLNDKEYLKVKHTLEFMANNHPQLFADQIDLILEITDSFKNNGEKELALKLYKFIVAKTNDPIAKIMVHDMTREDN